MISSKIKSDVEYDSLKHGDILLYTRVLSKADYYEILDVTVVNKYDDYCTVTEGRTKQTYIIGRNLANDVLYKNRKLALDYLVECEENYKTTIEKK